MERLRLLVVGTGRSGTGYMSRLLTESGIPCGHESVWTYDGVVDRPDLEADASWLAVPFLAHLPKHIRIIHVVRHPRAVVESLHRRGFFRKPLASPHRVFAWKYFNRTGKPVRDALRWYVEWNKRIEPYAHERIRVEDMPDNDFLARIGATRFGSPPTNENASNGGPNVRVWPTGPELDACVELASSYGYEF